MQVWAVANQKGGVGKTTTSVALGGLAEQAGKRVLLIDLDPHGSLTAYFRRNPDTLTTSVYNLFEHKDHLSADLIGQLLIDTPLPGFSVLPASGKLASLERMSIGRDGMGLVLSRALAQVWDDYDLVIMDCAPQLGVLMVNALAACQRLIIPVQTEYLALQGLERMLHTLKMVSRTRHKDLPFTIVPTMYDKRTRASVSVLRTLRNDYDGMMCPCVIPVDTKFRDASKDGIPPHLYSPQSQGVEAYRRLYEHFTQDRFVRPPLTQKKNLQNVTDRVEGMRGVG